MRGPCHLATVRRQRRGGELVGHEDQKTRFDRHVFTVIATCSYCIVEPTGRVGNPVVGSERRLRPPR